jgi:hypothetical protein
MMPIDINDVYRVFPEVKENLDRLESCPGPHSFVQQPSDNPLKAKQWVCASCKGVIHATDLYWYLSGLKHGIDRWPS